ncbi:MAG: hypothetical protein J6B11_06000 [Spirochaetales bacterium]|nr:hypothetical protein [Spirochaetales bacterium]
MKLHKILPIIFLIIAMMISCSQETVINENISGEATTPDTKICVNIKTENSRTVRPEITKWEITVTNKSNSNSLTFSRTIDGKATSATFVNVTADTYSIKVIGCNEKGKTILHALTGSFEVKPNTVNVCEIIPEDYFDYYDDNGNPRIGNLSIQISGLTDLFTEGETFLLTYTKLDSNDKTSKSETLPYEYTNGTLIREITEIPVGSYKIEISNSKNLNLVKDPVVNIYPETTTEINWEWNYDSDEINTDQKLKGIKIPVWNKPVSNRDSPAESSAPAKNGYLSANALFAEPTWDEEESYNFEYEHDDGSTISATVNKGELEFINCTYDEIGDLWVLSGTSDSKYFSGEDGSGYEYRYCYVLKNVSSSENEEYRFTCSEKILKDFAVATVSEQNDQNKQKYLLCITDTEDGNNIKSFKIEGEGGDLDEGTPYCSYGGNQYITAIYAKGDQLYIAISDIENETGSRFIKILKTELAADGSDNILEYKDDDGSEVLKLDINSFIEVENGYSFQSPAFAISDMYINEDKTKLYVTAGCVNYDGNSWNNNLDYGVYHSFGGLFEYTLDGTLIEKYGVYNGDNANSPFLIDDSGKIRLADHIIQATSDDSSYFAGPRYIIPSGNDLLIVDSGFYGLVDKTPGTNNPFSLYGKQNRIFTFNINENNNESEVLKFNSLTKVDDSISFDYDYLTSSHLY